MPSAEPLHPGVRIHPSAVVDEPCAIGPGSSVWHFCHVSARAALGPGCILGQNVFIAPDVVIGGNVKIQNNVSVYAGVTLEDDVFCGPSVVFTNVRIPRSEIVRRGEYVETVVRRGASLGANATIVCGTRIGRYALVGAGSVVTKDVPDYGLVTGVPGRVVGWACRCGERLPEAGGEGKIACSACGNSYAEENGSLIPLQEVQARDHEDPDRRPGAAAGLEDPVRSAP